MPTPCSPSGNRSWNSRPYHLKRILQLPGRSAQTVLASLNGTISWRRLGGGCCPVEFSRRNSTPISLMGSHSSMRRFGFMRVRPLSQLTRGKGLMFGRS